MDKELAIKKLKDRMESCKNTKQHIEKKIKSYNQLMEIINSGSYTNDGVKVKCKECGKEEVKTIFELISNGECINEYICMDCLIELLN